MQISFQLLCPFRFRMSSYNNIVPQNVEITIWMRQFYCYVFRFTLYCYLIKLYGYLGGKYYSSKKQTTFYLRIDVVEHSHSYAFNAEIVSLYFFIMYLTRVWDNKEVRVIVVGVHIDYNVLSNNNITWFYHM